MPFAKNPSTYYPVIHILDTALSANNAIHHLPSYYAARRWRNTAYYARKTHSPKYDHLIIKVKGERCIILVPSTHALTDLDGRDLQIRD